MVEIDVDKEIKKLETEREVLIRQIKALDDQRMQLLMRIEQINGVISFLKSKLREQNQNKEHLDEE